jgi:hypothetical protein
MCASAASSVTESSPAGREDKVLTAGFDLTSAFTIATVDVSADWFLMLCGVSAHSLNLAERSDDCST